MKASLLVVLDPTATDQPALDRAIWFAQKSGAALELFICAYNPSLAGEDAPDAGVLLRARKDLIAHHLNDLKQRARRITGQNLEVSVDARWDYPLHEGIERKVRESKPDIVFKDTHYHAAVRRAVFSNTDWSLIRSCPVPLWLVKPRPMAAQPCVVAAVDPLHEHDKPAELDHRILDIASEVSAAAHGELHLVHAYELAPALAATGNAMAMPISVPLWEIAESLEKQHNEAVDALAGRYGLDRNRVHVVEGRTRQVLVRLTEKLEADVVVLGAVSRSGLRRLFLGSTAEQVLDRLPCDVLIVKPAGTSHAELRRMAPRTAFADPPAMQGP
jgi:universal stress protein E